MQNSNSTTYMHVIFQKKKNEMENFARNNFRYWTVEHTVCNAKMPYCTSVIPRQCEWFTAWYNSQILYLDKCFDQISRQHYIFFNTTNHTLYIKLYTPILFILKLNLFQNCQYLTDTNTKFQSVSHQNFYFIISLFLPSEWVLKNNTNNSCISI